MTFEENLTAWRIKYSEDFPTLMSNMIDKISDMIEDKDSTTGVENLYLDPETLMMSIRYIDDSRGDRIDVDINLPLEELFDSDSYKLGRIAEHKVQEERERLAEERLAKQKREHAAAKRQHAISEKNQLRKLAEKYPEVIGELK